MKHRARTLTAALLAGAGALALIPAVPQAMEIKQAQAAVPEDDPTKETTLKALTDQVVDHLTRLRNGGKGNQLSTPADLQAALTALVKKAQQEGRTRTDILQLIDEALKERGKSLQDVMSNADSRTVLQQLVARAGNATTSSDDPFLRQVTKEGEATVITEGASGKGEKKTAGKVIVVQRGDTLTTLAEKHYGSMSAWRKIFAANKGKLSNPNLIPEGIKLRLP
ncbi:MAG TPA: LysM peptidoglycan-binding domain-containing protein [Thermopetrobacter sp.]|nr:LysM peptidoglycan-binding domain-containing protein [Thermopetrobacter sp.]